jgi:hypothetical protein
VERTFTVTGGDPVSGIDRLPHPSPNIHPNPASDCLYVDLDTAPVADGVYLSDVQGKRVAAPLSVAGKSLRIDISTLDAGIYVATLVAAEGNKRLKFIKL